MLVVGHLKCLQYVLIPLVHPQCCSRQNICFDFWGVNSDLNSLHFNRTRHGQILFLCCFHVKGGWRGKSCAMSGFYFCWLRPNFVTTPDNSGKTQDHTPDEWSKQLRTRALVFHILLSFTFFQMWCFGVFKGSYYFFKLYRTYFLFPCLTLGICGTR